MAVGPLFTHSLSSSGIALVEQYSISVSQFGYFAVVLFSSAGLASLLLAGIADRLTVVLQLILVHGGTAVAFLLVAVGSRLWVILFAAGVAGACQAFSTPITNLIVARSVSASLRPSWIGVKQSGVQAGQVVAGIGFPALYLIGGWRFACLVGAAFAVMLLVFGILIEKLAGEAREARFPDPASTVNGTSDGEVISGLGLVSQTLLLTGFTFMVGIGIQSTNVYLSLFAVERLEMSLVAGGVAVSVAGGIAILSRLAFTRSTWVLQHRVQTLLRGLVSGGVVAMAALILADVLHAPVLFWVGTCIHGATSLVIIVVVNSVIVQSRSGRGIGLATAVVAGGTYLGFASGPLVMGLLLSMFDGFLWAWVGVGTGYIGAFLILLAWGWWGSRVAGRP
nr:MFS transporter [Ornithinimicrobium cryptoxanthini]